MQAVKTPWAPFMGTVPMHLDYFQGTMAEAVERVAEKYAKYDAYEFMGSHVSYEKLVEQIHACAAALRPTSAGSTVSNSSIPTPPPGDAEPI